MIEIFPCDEVHNKVVTSDRGVMQEISDFFTFEVPGAKFMPIYKNGLWDGKIRLYNINTRKLYKGLTPYVEHLADRLGYEVTIHYDDSAANISIHEGYEFFENLKLPTNYQLRDYQIKAFVSGVRNSRVTFESPTASGKSLIMYALIRYYQRSTLIIVPSTSLVHQLANDFVEYGMPDKYIQKVSNEGKNVTKAIVITTWQAVYKDPKKWFEQFDVVIGDEVHHFQAKSLVTLMEKTTTAKYRFGFTGTLDEAKAHRYVIEGLFGVAKKVISTKEMIDRGWASNLRIKAIVLKYSSNDVDLLARAKRQYKDKRKKYQTEVDFLIDHEERTKFVKNLVISLEGNTLLLYDRIRHGQMLYNQINDECDNGRKVFFVHGGVAGEDRDEIRQIIDSEENAIIVASYGTMSTGVNIPRLHNLIFASPTKSAKRVLQSIGRSLRKARGKNVATLFDISDDLSTKGANFSLRHLFERINHYKKEQHKFKVYKVKL